MVEGGMSCVKYILGIFSFVFVVFSILLIVFGSLSLSSASSFEEIIETPDGTAIFSILIGIILFAISFLGCCGALRENHCMLITFSVFLIIIVVIEFIIAGLVIAFKKNIPDLAVKSFTKKLCDYNETNHEDPLTKFFDEVQKKFECCGGSNKSDWYMKCEKNQTHFNETNLPLSCCKDSDIHVNGTIEQCSSDKAFDAGCGPIAADLLRQSFGVLGGVMLSIALLQLLGIVFSCCLAYAVKKEYQVV